MNHVAKCKKNGRTQWRVDYEGSDGHRHQKFKPTSEQAEDFLASETIASRQKTTSDLAPGMTVAEYAAHWLCLIETHVKRRTLHSYGETLRLHLLPAFGPLRVRDLQRGRIKVFLAKKLDTHKPNTVRIMHATLRVMLNAALDDGLIVANPADKLGRSLKLVTRTKVRQETIKAMDRDQRDRFLATAYQVEPWWAPMWEVQVLSGLRPGETYALSEEDFDLNPKHATARIARTLADDGQDVEDTPKGNRGRTIDLSARAVAVIKERTNRRKVEKLRREWREMPTAFFCSADGTYAGPRDVRKAFARVIKAAKLPHFTPHGLRHTYASLLLVAGVDVYYVSRMLGHASIQETVDTYGRWLPANRVGALDALDPVPVAADINRRSVTNL
jgi:integrase